MERVYLACVLATVAVGVTSTAPASVKSSTSSHMNDEDTGHLIRESDFNVYTLLEEESFIWNIAVMSWFDRDLGEEKIRITHYLDGNIRYNDIVSFDLYFTGSMDPYTNPIIMLEDVAKCQVEISAVDDRFWT